MRMCASVACHNSSRHLTKWKQQLCGEHAILQQFCKCAPPFRFHYFPSSDLCVRDEWIRRVGRQESDGRSRWEPRKDSVLCSEHFVNGCPSTEYPVPWLKMGRDFGPPKPARRLPSRSPLARPVKKEPVGVGCNVTIGNEREEALPKPPDLNKLELPQVNMEEDAGDQVNMVEEAGDQVNMEDGDHNYHFVCCCRADCQCPGCLNKQNTIRQLQEQLAQKPRFVIATKVKVKTVYVKQKPAPVKMVPILLKSDKKVRFYTGLPSRAVFDLLFKYLEPKLAKMPCWRGAKETVNKVHKRTFYSSPAKFGPTRKLPLKEEFLMVLMRLRLGLLNEDLADRFGISPAHASRVFTTWIKATAVEMAKAVSMPPQEEIRANLPRVFNQHYKQLRGILDCTEIFIQRPRSLEIQAMTHSDYKSHNTAKILVCITPRGKIGFVSKAWGGRASDKHIVNESGFLDLVMPHDQYMVDKGFPIRKELMARSADLVIPPAAQGKVQSLGVDVALTKRIANLRIHVERAIGRLKVFRILANTLPITLVPLLDDIVMTCAGLSNFHDNLV